MDNEPRIYTASSTEQCRRCLKVVGGNIQLIKDGICAECNKELFDKDYFKYIDDFRNRKRQGGMS